VSEDLEELRVKVPKRVRLGLEAEASVSGRSWQEVGRAVLLDWSDHQERVSTVLMAKLRREGFAGKVGDE
jgi:hypothetical protein